MTKKELESVYYLKRELKMWQDRRAELEADVAPPIKQLTGMPFSNTNENHSPTEEKAIRLMECATAIDEKIKELKLAINNVEEYILSIDDARMRVIMELRCVQCWNWKMIALYLGEGFTEDMIRQSYHRFMNDLKGKECKDEG